MCLLLCLQLLMAQLAVGVAGSFKPYDFWDSVKVGV